MAYAIGEIVRTVVYAEHRRKFEEAQSPEERLWRRVAGVVPILDRDGNVQHPSNHSLLDRTA